MARLIDKDKLRKDILDLPNCYNGYSDTYDKACIIDMIDEQPTVNVCPYWDNESDYCALNKPSDAEPARHGHWNENNDGTLWCSVCISEAPCEEDYWGYVRNAPRYDYCPNCGAKMDEVTEDGLLVTD